jgi:hypothetical protein
MTQEKHAQAVLSIIFVFILIIVNISGCTSNQNTRENENILSGTWTGNVEIPLFRINGNASVSKIKFSGSTAEMSVESGQGTFMMNYSYSINGSTLVFVPKFNGRVGVPGRQSNNSTQPGNWTRAPGNETGPINGTHHFNGSGPENWTRTENGTGNLGGGRPSMSISFTYSLNEEHTVLYLNGSPFNKVQ